MVLLLVALSFGGISCKAKPTDLVPLRGAAMVAQTDPSGIYYYTIGKYFGWHEEAGIDHNTIPIAKEDIEVLEGS